MKKSIKNKGYVIIVLLMVICSLQITVHAQEVSTVASGTCGEDIVWSLDSNGLLTIDGSGYMMDYKYENAPWHSYRKSIKSINIIGNIENIGYSAFSDCYYMTNINIPNSVTKIGSYAFFGSGIVNMTIPESVTEIGNDAFNMCKNLTSVYIHDGISIIPAGLFEDCSELININIPDSVTIIGGAAFRRCNKLSNVTIPKNVTQIFRYAFYNCCSMKSVIIPDSITNIGEYAFNGCESLKYVFYNGTSTQWSSISFDFGNTCLKSSVIHYSTTDHIWNSDYTVDTESTCAVTGSKSIHCSVCDVIKNDSNISIPVSENHITELRNEKEATYTLTGYTGDKVCKICGKIIEYGTVIPVKERVEATGKFALLKIFLQKEGLTDSDGNKYFKYLDNEQENIINTGTITYIEDNAQFEFKSRSVSDKGISTIKMLIEENGSREVTVEYSFDTVSLNASATFDVKNYTTDGNVYFEKTSYNILDNSQIQNLCNAELHVAFCCWDLLLLDNFGLDINMADLGFTSYEEAGTHTWADNYTYVSTEPTCTESGIMTYICKICKETRTEEIPAIGHRWDNGIITTNPTALKQGVRTYTCTVCGGTKQEEIPASGVPKKGSIISDHHSSYRVTRSGTKNATVEFLGTKSSRTSITIPDTIVVDGIKYKVTSVASNAFKNNRKLTKVTIGSNVISIGKNAFSGCGKLKTITMGNKVTSIGDNAFYKCTALSKITIPSKVTKIGKQAFYYCKKLNSITIKTVRLTSKNVGSKAFAGTPSNVKIKVPKSKISAYKKLLISKGISKKATIKK